MPANKQLSEWIDFLKGMAITEIVIFHFFGDHAIPLIGSTPLAPSHLDQLVTAIQYLLIRMTHVGSQGIHVFFFLSGVGIALSEHTRLLSWPTFLLRRLLRVYPPYLLAVVFVVILQLTTNQASWTDTYQSNVIVSALLLRNYSSDWIGIINGNWWFVGALIPMYLTHVVVRSSIQRSPIRWFATALVTSFGYKLLIAVALFEKLIDFDAGVLNPFTAFFLNYWWEFVAGVVFYRLRGWDHLQKLFSRSPRTLFIAGFLAEGLGILLGFSSVGRIFNDDYFAIAQVLTLSGIFLALRAATGIRRFLIAAIGSLGVSSYGLYLMHHPISKTLMHYGVNTTSLWMLIVFFLPYFLVCWEIGKLIELGARKSVATFRSRLSLADEVTPQ